PGGAVRAYLRGMRPPQLADARARAKGADPKQAARDFFEAPPRRDYCYLSKSRVAPYRANALAAFKTAIEKAQPVHIFLDLGGGYHASLRPGIRPLDFSVGLAEWFVLGQIARFARDVGAIYAPGARFSVVIDNLSP